MVIDSLILKRQHVTKVYQNQNPCPCRQDKPRIQFAQRETYYNEEFAEENSE